MVITRTVEMHAQLVGYDFKKKGSRAQKWGKWQRISPLTAAQGHHQGGKSNA